METLIQQYKKRIKALQNAAQLTPKKRDNLLKQLQKNNLLTPDFANTKTAKNIGLGVASYILHLAPHTLSGYNVCPKASLGCSMACLNTAGRGRFEAIQLARIQKTLYFFKFRVEFLAQLIGEIAALEKRAIAQKLLPVVRLNGTSDLPWENIKIDGKNIFELHIGVQFYDYTKIVARLEKLAQNPIKNYDLTFSASEDNALDVTRALQLGFNVAQVFLAIPEHYNGVKVINGDVHDLRFTDLKGGYIVGLKAKGAAKKDMSGFVVRNVEVKNVA